MEDPSFNIKGIHVVNVILEYFYLGLLMMCFILALGNRPQGSKLGYTLAFVGFAIITIYMTVRRSAFPFQRYDAYAFVLGGSIFACVQRHREPVESAGQNTYSQ
jgi:chitin synthase